jgi:predicted dehydrogenase
MLRVAAVGLGQAAAFSIAALREVSGVQVVAGVDPAGTRAVAKLDTGAPVYESVAAMPTTGLDLVVVATPTPTHVAVCRHLFQRTPPPPRILCEKPLTADHGEAESLFALAAESGVRLEVLFHYAFSPEALWTRARWETIRRAHGSVVSFESRFRDPKPDLGAAALVLGSSWVDSGINAMSVLARFVQLERLVAFHGDVESGWGEVRFRSGESVAVGRIETTWTAEEVDKVTQLALADGTTVTLDHLSQTARLGEQTLFEAPMTTSPGLTRYAAMVGRYLSDDADVFDRDLTLRLHSLLARAGDG